MNKRTLLILAGLALPPALLAIIIQSHVPSLKIDAPAHAPAPPPQAAAGAPTGPGAISTAPVTLPPLNVPVASGRYPAAAAELDDMRQRIRQRLSVLARMTPADWPAERERNRHALATLDEARRHNALLIAELDAMTPDQWAAGRRPSQLGGDFTVPQAPQSASPAR